MDVKVKLYAITDEACGPEFIGPVSTAPYEMYAKFREFLEKEGILEWPFDFWETKKKCRLLPKLERFNAIGSAVFVIPRGGSDDGPLKRRGTDPHAFVQDSVVVDTKREDLDLLEAEEGDAMPPTRSSRCNGVVDVEEEEVLKSILVPKEVIEKYQYQ
jgi:hypothetical protein